MNGEFAGDSQAQDQFLVLKASMARQKTTSMDMLRKDLTCEVDPEIRTKESSFPSGELGVGPLGLVQ